MLYYIVDGRGARSILDEQTVESKPFSDNILQQSLIHYGTGGSSNCHSTDVSSETKINAETSQVQTCDDLSLSITGGTKPYTVSVVSTNFTNNFTLGATDDGFNYIDQVDTGDGFIGMLI